MFGLEKVADAFDRMHEEVQRDFENKVLRDWGRDAGEAWGAESWKTYGTAIGAGLLYSLGTFTLSSGKSLVDTLRIGDGVRSGTAAGVGQDVLRVLNLAPAIGAAAKGIGWGGRLALAARAGGVAGQQGLRSCAPTAIAAAARVSGQNVAMTLDDVGIAVGKGMHPNASSFPGMVTQEIKDVVKSVSLVNQEISFEGQGVEAVEAAVKTGKGPVIFSIHLWEKSAAGFLQGGSNSLGEPEHALAAFERMGKVMVADQYGIRPIGELGKVGGTTHNFTIAGEAIQVTDGVLLRTTPVLRALGKAERLGSVTGPLRGPAGRSLFATTFGLNMIIVNAPATWRLDAGVRAVQGRPPREWPGMPPGTIPARGSSSGTKAGTTDGGAEEAPTKGAAAEAPTAGKAGAAGAAGATTRGAIPAPKEIPTPNLLSRTLQQDGMHVLSKLPQNGDSREFTQLASDTGLPEVRLRDALLMLARSGLISAGSWFALQGKATPAMAARTMRQPRARSGSR